MYSHYKLTYFSVYMLYTLTKSSKILFKKWGRESQPTWAQVTKDLLISKPTGHLWVPTLLDLLEESLHLVNSFFPFLFSQQVPPLGLLSPPACPMQFSPNPLFPFQNIHFFLSRAAWVLLNASQILLLLSLKPFPKALMSQVKLKTPWAIKRGLMD